MTANEFRRMALELPEATEGAHMGHPDFRVGGKIFATLWPDDGWGMVKLTTEQQKMYVRAEPASFEPIPGGWGRNGATKVRLKPAKKAVVRAAMAAAWRNTAPKRLAAEHEADV